MTLSYRRAEFGRTLRETPNGNSGLTIYRHRGIADNTFSVLRLEFFNLTYADEKILQSWDKRQVLLWIKTWLNVRKQRFKTQ